MSKYWTNERVENLEGLAGSQEDTVSQDSITKIAEALNVSNRSIGSKLRSIGYTVQLASDAKKSDWDADTQAELEQFLASNEGELTYAEIAAVFSGGKYSAKSIQGKVLSLELTSSVKKSQRPAVLKEYTDDQEVIFIKMAAEGASMEEISEALGKSIPSIRGKALSLSRTVEGFNTPYQATSHAKNKVDAIESLGDLSNLTVEEIADNIGKTERGVRTALTRRKLVCKNYNGVKKSEKRAEKTVEKTK